MKLAQVTTKNKGRPELLHARRCHSKIGPIPLFLECSTWATCRVLGLVTERDVAPVDFVTTAEVCEVGDELSAKVLALLARSKAATPTLADRVAARPLD